MWVQPTAITVIPGEVCLELSLNSVQCIKSRLPEERKKKICTCLMTVFVTFECMSRGLN